MIKLIYLNGENAADAVRINWRNHKLRREPCSVKTLGNLLMQFEETGCACDKFRSEWLFDPVEVVVEVIIAGPLHTARSVTSSLDAQKPQILRFVFWMFPCRF